MDVTLTIAVPTFNRPDTLCALLRKAQADGVFELAAVSVYDDGSDSATRTALEEHHLLQTVTYKRNASNLGYARNFVRIISEAESTFVMLTTDDDVLDRRGIELTIEELNRDRADALVTTFHTHEGAPYRWRSSPGRVLPSELHQAFSHAPGLVYRTEMARRYLPILVERLSRGCAATTYYPQVVLGTVLAARHEVLWTSAAPVREGARLPTGLRDSQGRAYDASVSRFAQVMAFDEVFSSLLLSATTKDEIGFMSAVVRRHREAALGRILGAVRREAPQMASALDRSAATFAIRHPLRSLRALVATRAGR